MSNSNQGAHAAGAAFQIPDFRDNAPISANPGKEQGYQVTVVICAPAGTDIYVGTSNAVDATHGLRVPAGSTYFRTLAPSERAWVFGTAGTFTWDLVAY